jgi:hypothetical protein
MGEKEKIIRRQDLHAKVWASTLKKVAEDLGITLPEVSQLCETLNVPRPPQGHWQRIKLGLPVETIPLPNADAGTVLQAEIQPKKLRRPESLVALQDADNLKATIEPVKNSGQQEIVTRPSKSAPTQEKKPAAQPEPVVPECMEYTREQLYEAIWTWQETTRENCFTT